MYVHMGQVSGRKEKKKRLCSDPRVLLRVFSWQSERTPPPLMGRSAEDDASLVSVDGTLVLCNLHMDSHVQPFHSFSLSLSLTHSPSHIHLHFPSVNVSAAVPQNLASPRSILFLLLLPWSPFGSLRHCRSRVRLATCSVPHLRNVRIGSRFFSFFGNC